MMTNSLLKSDNGKKTRMFSLRRQILRFVITLAFLLLLIMITVMTILIHSYQRKVDSTQWENVSSYAASIDNSVLQLRDTVGYIYSENSIFQGLYL